MEILSILMAGFLLGMRHATDADHIVAVTTIVSRQKRLSAASLIGMFWGLGHTLTILLIGSAIIYFKLVIPPRVGLLMEFSVGIMIVLLGIHSLRAFAQKTGSLVGKEHKQQMSRPFAVGLIHGLAGSAAVALLMLSLIPSPSMAALYLLVFGLGTMAGMIAVTLAIGIPYILSLRLHAFHRYLGIATAAVSILFGLDMMYELGIENGLFSDNPQWTPE